MAKSREILTMRWLLQRGVGEVASSVGVSTGVVSQTTQRAELAGLRWADIEAMDDGELEAALQAPPASTDPRPSRPMPDPLYIHQELRRPGVTLLHRNSVAGTGAKAGG